MLTPIFKDSDFEIRKLVPSQVLELMQFADKNDAQLVKDAFDLMISLLNDSYGFVRMETPKYLQIFINKMSPQLSRKAIEALIPSLQGEFTGSGISASTCIAGIIKNESKDLVLIKEIINSTIHLLKEKGPQEKNQVARNLTEIVIFAGDGEMVNETVKNFIPLFGDSQPSVRDQTRENIKKIVQGTGRIADVIAIVTPVLADSNSEARKAASMALTEIVKINEETKLERNRVMKALIPLLKDSQKDVRGAALKNITELVKLGDVKSVKDAIEHFVPILQDDDNQIRISASSCIIELLALNDNDQAIKENLNLVTPLLQHSNSDIAKNAFEVVKSMFPKLLLNPDSFEKYLTHSSMNVRDSITSYLLSCVEKYLNRFQELELMSQRPLTDVTLEVIMGKLFVNEKKKDESFQEKVKNCLEKSQEEPEKLRELLVSEINKIEGLKGPGIIELAIVSIGQEKVLKEDSDRKKLIESAKEVLNIQLKYLDEEGLIWINKNCEKLLALSAEAKVFYKKVYHKLLEDGQVTSLEEELLIKFINQGLTTSLTRSGEIIFEGKRYKLKGEDIELALEKIAKTVIEQQQDVLATQYKQHEPIFKISSLKGGMKQAAADIKEIRSIVDSRHALKIESWLLTKLKSLKFNSEIFLLEQRSAFGDHVIYHFGQQRLIRFYPNEIPALQDIFGSYIYGEAYQSEVTELADKVGEKLLESKGDIKPTKIQIEGSKLKSRQIYFQQELLKQGNEDRNSAVEEELAKKLDNNRAVLGAKLKSFNLKDTETNIIEDYYEGFVSTFSSVYTSSQAIDSGKLSIDDGEDFFSPVNLFIQLTSLAPFGIGDILSSGLEAARSYIKSTIIANEAKFVKDIAIDAVELSDLVSKIALNIISNKEQRKEILEAKDDEEANTLINKAKNLITEKIEKLKVLAEKYTKVKNLFEKEIETSPAFRLGEADANKIIKEWIDLKGSQPDLRMKPEEKQKKFVKMILGEVGEGNKITPMPANPQEVRSTDKTGCCEIF